METGIAFWIMILQIWGFGGFIGTFGRFIKIVTTKHVNEQSRYARAAILFMFTWPFVIILYGITILYWILFEHGIRDKFKGLHSFFQYTFEGVIY